jgi:predicted homoserine dehydrogenase-like protein
MKLTEKNSLRVGIVGTGKIARGLAQLISFRTDMVVSGIITRRTGLISDLLVSQDLVTQNADRLMEKSDLIFVSTGDPVYSTLMIDKAFSYNLPVMTMDADTLVVSGSWLAQRGKLCESDGDQPGCLAELKVDIEEMGFSPLVYGNIKGFHNTNPSREDMEYWAGKQGYSLSSVTSFTDGTKLQIEQCLVANGLNASIACQALIGERISDLKTGAFNLALIATELNKVLSDYIISAEAPPGVFIVATHHKSLAPDLKTYKLGDGPYYLHYNPTHLCFFETPKTIKDFYYGNKILLNNGTNPTVGVASIAKRTLQPGTIVNKGIGSFEVRGEAINICDASNMVPIGLMDQVHIKRVIEPGQIITFDDVDISESLALTAWLETIHASKKSLIPA